MQPVSDTRARLLTATNESFRRRGFNGTSLKHVTAAAGAPIGSLYHFFPGGKEELAAATIESSGDAYRQLFEVIAGAAPDIAHAITDFFDGAATALEETDFIDPCPIGTVAREVASTNDDLRAATQRVFSSWIDAAATHLEEAGASSHDARELALTLVAALEGGFVLARSARDAEPIRAAGRALRRLVEQTLAVQSVGPLST
jgi:AcrR family transcriptional regulator